MEEKAVKVANMNTDFLEEKLEFLSEEVHKAWMEEKLSQGFHAPTDCPLYNDADDSRNQSGKFTRHCGKCHTDLYGYEELPENVKEYDRVTVLAVIKAMEKI